MIQKLESLISATRGFYQLLHGDRITGIVADNDGDHDNDVKNVDLNNRGFVIEINEVCEDIPPKRRQIVYIDGGKWCSMFFMEP